MSVSMRACVRVFVCVCVWCVCVCACLCVCVCVCVCPCVCVLCVCVCVREREREREIYEPTCVTSVIVCLCLPNRPSFSVSITMHVSPSVYLTVPMVTFLALVVLLYAVPVFWWW